MRAGAQTVSTRRVVGLLLLILAALLVGTWAADQDGDLSTPDAPLAVSVEDARPHGEDAAEPVDGHVDDTRSVHTHVIVRTQRSVGLRFAILFRRWHRAFLGDVPI
jgi:hypothetical protein